MSDCPVRDEDGIAYCTCTPEEVLRLLADRRRRRIVATLELCADNWITIEGLIQQLPEADRERPSERWRLSLQHVHLPMLEDEGIIEYDTQSETIRYYDCELVSAILAVVKSQSNE